MRSGYITRVFTDTLMYSSYYFVLLCFRLLLWMSALVVLDIKGISLGNAIVLQESGNMLKLDTKRNEVQFFLSSQIFPCHRRGSYPYTVRALKSTYFCILRVGAKLCRTVSIRIVQPPAIQYYSL